MRTIKVLEITGVYAITVMHADNLVYEVWDALQEEEVVVDFTDVVVAATFLNAFALIVGYFVVGNLLSPGLLRLTVVGIDPRRWSNALYGQYQYITDENYRRACDNAVQAEIDNEYERGE